MREQEGEELFDDLSCQSAPENKNAVAARLRAAERRQIALRAVCLDELVPNDHRVRMVWSFVEGLNLSALLAGIKSVEGRPGHPPCDPRILMALWLYATVEGVASARRIARLCEDHIAYQWLCGGVGMNAKTLADFGLGMGLRWSNFSSTVSRRWRRRAWQIWIVWRKTVFGCVRPRSGVVSPAFDAGGMSRGSD